MAENYAVLGLSAGASQDEVKAKYRELALRWHPDKNKDRDTTEEFKKIQSAYEAIMQGGAATSPQQHQAHQQHQPHGEAVPAAAAFSFNFSFPMSFTVSSVSSTTVVSNGKRITTVSRTQNGVTTTEVTECDV